MLIDYNKLFGLKGRVALVTGAAQGMGEAIARYLAGAGATVAVTDVNLELSEKVAADIVTEGGSAKAWRLDIAEEANIVDVVAAVRAEFGRLDILVNNAGIQQRSLIEDITGEYWDRVIDINLRGPALMLREAIKVMRADQVDGRIVNISSVSSMHPMMPGLYAYAASKAGVASLSRAAALETSANGIRINSVLPGGTATPGSAASGGTVISPEVGARLAPPLGRFGTAEDIAAAVLFAVSDASSFMTGQTLIIDGGWLACS